MSINNLQSIRTQFLTSTFGGYLPPNLIIFDLSFLMRQYPNTEHSTNDNACRQIPLEISQHLNKIYSSSTTPIALMVKRGGCRFDQKAYNLEKMKEHGLRHPLSLMIIYDIHDEPLQRLGGLHPTDGYLSIPSIMIPYHTAELIQTALEQTNLEINSSPVTATLSSSYTTSVFSDWVDIALTSWEVKDENQLLQLEGLKLKYSRGEIKRSDNIERDDLLAWLERKRNKIERNLIRKDEL